MMATFCSKAQGMASAMVSWGWPSPVQDTSSSGLGANSAAISTLKVSSRRFGAFSHRQPPWKWAEIMFTGTAT